MDFDDLARSVVQLGTFEDASQQLVGYYSKLQTRNAELEQRLRQSKEHLMMVKDAYETKAAKAAELENQVKILKEENNRLKKGGDFAAVLLDGDGCIWTRERLIQGVEGGKAAAADLRNAIAAETEAASLEVNQIVVMLFLNKRGLLGVLKENGVPYDLVEGFITGFNQAEPLITCVDCAQIKEGVDEKLKAYARLYSNLPQCRRLFLGVSHDKSYASTLEMFKTRGLDDKVRLLQSYSHIPRDLTVLQSDPVRVHGLFLEQKLPARGLSEQAQPFVPAHPIPLPMVRPSVDTSIFPILSCSPSSASDAPAPPTPCDSPHPRNPSPPYNASIKKATVTSSPSSSPKLGPVKGVVVSYSAVANSKNRRPSFLDLPLKVASECRGSFGNPKPGKSFWADGAKAPTEQCKDMKTIFSKRPCHYYYLRQSGCYYGDACTYSHHIDMTKEQLKTMRMGAKTQPCYDEQKTGCHEPDCFRGHACPFGSNCTNPACKFRSTPGMHPAPVTSSDQASNELQELYTYRRDRDRKDLLTNGGMYDTLPSAQSEDEGILKPEAEWRTVTVRKQ